MIDFDGTVILVTGGSRGIGAAAVRAMAGAGARTIVHYASNRAAANEVVADVGADRAIAIGADLVSPEATELLWDEALAWRGHIDVLVNNGGHLRAHRPGRRSGRLANRMATGAAG